MPDTKVLNSNVIEVIQQKQAQLADGDAAHQATAQRSLRKLATKYPAEAKAAGYTGETAKAVLVRMYGCLAAPRVLENPLDEDPIEQQMRLRHAFYNALVLAVLPIRAAVLELMRGTPAQQEYCELKVQCRSAKEQQDVLFAAAFSAEQQAQENRPPLQKHEKMALIRKVKKTAEFIALKEQMKVLTLRSKELKPVVWADKKKVEAEGRKTELDDLFRTTVSKIRKHFVSDLGLRDHNMSKTLEQLTVAYKNSLRSIDSDDCELKPRYTNKDGEYPDDLLTWEKWNREGSVTVRMTHQGDPNKDPATVYAGTNTLFRLIPLTQADWKLFNSYRPLALTEVEWNRQAKGRLDRMRRRGAAPDKIAKVAEQQFDSKNPGLLFLAQVRVGSDVKRKPIWASVPVKIHDPIPESAELSEVSIFARREGLHLVHTLNVTWLAPAPSPVRIGGAAGITIKFEKGNPVFASFYRPMSEEFLSWAGKGPDGRRFAWLNPSGEISVNPAFLSSENKTRSLNDNVAIYANLALEMLHGNAKKGIKGLLASAMNTGVHGPLPGWYEDEVLGLETRSNMRYFYRRWRFHLFERQEPTAIEPLRKALRDTRRIARDKVKLGFDHAVNLVASSAQKSLHMRPLEAQLFGVLTVFVERYEHLYEWAFNNRSKNQRRRLDFYRKLAANFLQGVKTLRVPDVYLASRNLSEEQKAACPSELLAVLKNYAKREGIAIELFKPAPKGEN